MGMFDGGKKRGKGAIMGGLAMGSIGANLGALFGGAKTGNFLFGEESKDIKGRYERQDPRITQLLDLGQAGKANAIGAYSDEISRLRSMNAGKMAKHQTDKNLALTERGMLGSLEDQKRKISELGAQRGLGNSSIGIGSILGAQRSTGDSLARQKADIRTNQQNLSNQISGQKIAGIADAQRGISSVTSGMPQRNYMSGASGARGGGMYDLFAPIVGGVMGGVMGGPAGAAAGKGAGSGMAKIGRGMA